MARKFRVDLRITRLLLQIGLMRARQGEFEDALRIIRSVKAFRDDVPHPGASLGLTYLYQGRLKLAQQELLAVLETFPGHQLARALLGLVYREAGRDDWQQPLQEVIEDASDEWAVGLARSCLGSNVVEAGKAPHTQRVYG